MNVLRRLDDRLLPDILSVEVEQVLKNLKIERTPSLNKINNNVLKECRNSLKKPLTNLFNEIIKTKNIPEPCKVSEIILIHNKGYKNQLQILRIF